ncbi:MAG: hypothetical protein V9F03_13700 [Microthrixaceae bacterium]
MASRSAGLLLYWFAEVDRAAWFDVESARTKLTPAQIEFLDRLYVHLSRTGM